MISSISQYIASAHNLSRTMRTLRNCQYLKSGNNEIGVCVGNSAVVFCVEINGEKYSLKAYFRTLKNMRIIYKEQYLPREMMTLYGDGLEEWSDVVISKWIDGESLHQFIEREYGNSEKMAKVANLFESFALELLDKEWAHGDLKPENIILNEEGLHLVDFDSMYLPGFSMEDMNDYGTRNYQHPLRHTLFGKSIDDYPIALIAVALHAMAIEPSLGDSLLQNDYMLIDPAKAIENRCETLNHIESLFAQRGDARHYHLARLLRWKSPTLPNLRALLCDGRVDHDNSQPLELAEERGLWGYKANGRFVIPPLYDIGFEFSEGVASVQVGEEWHFIDEQGKMIIHCGKGSKLKPMRNGVTHITRKDGSIATIYSDGRII